LETSPSLSPFSVLCRFAIRLRINLQIIPAVAKTILRDYINATVGFTGLAEATHIPSKSLMRMFGPAGNPRSANFFEIVSFLQQREGVRFHITARSNP
jgi:hypothetical protein